MDERVDEINGTDRAYIDRVYRDTQPPQIMRPYKGRITFRSRPR
jgi:hypothetical protein